VKRKKNNGGGKKDRGGERMRKRRCMEKILPYNKKLSRDTISITKRKWYTSKESNWVKPRFGYGSKREIQIGNGKDATRRGSGYG